MQRAEKAFQSLFIFHKSAIRIVDMTLSYRSAHSVGFICFEFFLVGKSCVVHDTTAT